jgi:hypothetical protein
VSLPPPGELQTPLSVQEFENDLRLTDATEKTLAERYLRAALRELEGRCGAIPAREVTVPLPAGHAGSYAWPYGPIITPPDGVTVSVDGYMTGIDPDATDLTLTVGRDPVPEDLALAVFVRGGELWERRRGRAGRPQAFASPADNGAPMGQRFTVESLTADYRLPGFA